MTAKQIQARLNSVLTVKPEHLPYEQVEALWEIAKQFAIMNEQKYGTGVQTHHSNN